MKYLFYIITGVLALAAIWRIGFDTGGQPARLVFDTPDRKISTRTPHPAGSIPFGPELPATGSGAELFAIHCVHCHGASGDGRSYIAIHTGMPAVGNLQTTERTPEELRQITVEGRGAMPAFRDRLHRANLDALLQHIITLQPCENESSL